MCTMEYGQSERSEPDPGTEGPGQVGDPGLEGEFSDPAFQFHFEFDRNFSFGVVFVFGMRGIESIPILMWFFSSPMR